MGAEQRAYRPENSDPVLSALNMGKYAEERDDQVVRTCCPHGIEVGRDQQALSVDIGGLQFQRPARVSRYVVGTDKCVRGIQEWQGIPTASRAEIENA